MELIAHSRLSLEPDPLALRELGSWLGTATQLLPDRAAAATLLARAELAVHEACMNVVDHAQLPAGEVIELDLVLTADRLTVRVVDWGEEFRLSDVPNPPADVLQERGYGVKIIRSIVSDLTYRRDDSTNVLELTIDVGAQP